MKKINVDTKKIAEESNGLLKEFKEFISRGNVMDLAVGVIIGGAFSNIVTSFTSILTDLIGTILGGIDFKGLSYHVGNLTVQYGIFLQAVFDFLITAICIFILIKIVNKLVKKHKKEEVVVEAPRKDENTILLEEIRDLLKENTKSKQKKTK